MSECIGGLAEYDKMRLLYSLSTDGTIKLSMKEYFGLLLHKVLVAEWRRTMIEEIIKLREDGLSFRKIASQLNTTVGRVQYRWNKYVNNQENNEEFQ